MNVNRPYSHRVVPHVDDVTRRLECRVCPRPVIGEGPTLRHHDEAVQPRIPNPAMADAVQDAVDIGTRALEATWTDRMSDRDRAQIVIQALEEAGAIAPRRQWLKLRRRAIPTAA